MNPTGSGVHSTPKTGENPKAATAGVLANQLKQMTTQELQQIMSAPQLEMRGRQDASLGSAQDVSAVLQTLLKEGALRTYHQAICLYLGDGQKRCPLSSGAMSSKHSTSQSYSDSALREGIQCSLRGVAADAVCNMGPSVPLDMILKKFTFIYGNVKFLDLLMRDFYRADQGEDEAFPSFATRIEGGQVPQLASPPRGTEALQGPPVPQE